MTEKERERSIKGRRETKERENWPSPKHNKTRQNKTNQRPDENKTKQNKTKQNKINEARRLTL